MALHNTVAYVTYVSYIIKKRRLIATFRFVCKEDNIVVIDELLMFPFIDSDRGLLGLRKTLHKAVLSIIRKYNQRINSTVPSDCANIAAAVTENLVKR